MSWIQKLVETYNACFRMPQFTRNPLAPISTVPQTTQLHMELHSDGSFHHASLVEERDTCLFVSEDSATRSGKFPAPNPLTEQLEYCAKGSEHYGGKSDKYDRYVRQLKLWSESPYGDPKITGVLKYIENGTMLDDLLKQKVLCTSDDALQKVKAGKGNAQDPLKIWVRWSIIGTRQAETWSDAELTEKWQKFEAKQSRNCQFCMASGINTRTTQKHPARIRFTSDRCKLISSNDTGGYTFRGRFDKSEEALTVGYVESQKAHNALRWLIAHQGAKNGDQVVVAWSVKSADAPPVVVDSWQFFRDAVVNTEEVQSETYEGDAGQYFALRLKKAIGGYKQKLDDYDDIVVISLDSATQGRMAILFYREFKESEFLTRLERWHASLAWPQNMDKERRFIGAPAPHDIALACYERNGKIDEKLLKSTQERLLPCIVDGRPLPRDLVLAAVANTVRCANQKAQKKGSWEFERNLGVACSLYRGAHPKENYSMSLDESRTSRDYLYGRLLALADSIEGLALNVASVQRDTTAARLMQRFADHPFTTWRTIELQLTPYIAQLRSSRAAALQCRQSLIDEVYSKFESSSGNGAFLDNRPLSGEFLLGFHSQREALRPRKNNSSVTDPEASSEEGDNS
ncbi:MAG: type I-C CRISPR-associated protein Cas8c/Csd1 [Terracidiphilus sp.]|nr:type I-C CRISPR-associated protein Cas8c/Csd1 [Terracidiphilus sp.]